MSTANVRSIHMLHEFRASLVTFREDSGQCWEPSRSRFGACSTG